MDSPNPGGYKFSLENESDDSSSSWMNESSSEIELDEVERKRRHMSSDSH